MPFSVRRNLAWMGLSQSCMLVIQFGGSVIIARLLSPYEMGVYAVAAATIGVLAIIRNIGLSTYIIREPVLTDALKATVFTVNAVLCVLLACIIAGLAQVGGALLGDEGVSRVMTLLAVIPLIGIFDLIPNSCLERGGAFGTIALISVARVLTSTVVPVALAYHGYSYMSIAWGTLGSTLVGAICCNILGWRHASIRLGVHDWRQVTRFGSQILAITSIGNIAARLSEVLLGRFAGLEALGLYSRASGLNGLLWDNIHGVLGRIVFVDFSERRRRGLPLRESYLRIIAMITGLLWPAFGGMAVLAGPIIYTIYGPKWVAAALPLSLLSLSGLVLTSITMNAEIYVISNQVTRQFLFEAKRVGVGLSVFTLGCLCGLPWAAGARIVEALAMVGFAKRDMEELTETSGPDYRPIFLHSAALTLAACLPATVLMVMTGWSAETPLHSVTGAVVLGVLGWVALLRVLRHPLYEELAGALGQLRRRITRRRA